MHAPRWRALLMRAHALLQAVNAANASRLPILLATKALPEMEAEDAGLLWAHRDAAGGAPVGEQYEALGVRLIRPCCPVL